MKASAEMKAEYKKMNEAYDCFFIELYDGRTYRFYSGYGHAYRAANALARRGIWNRICGVKGEEIKELAAC